MARTDTLANFLTDVAESIRTKEDTTEQIPASEFDTRIANLSGGLPMPEKGFIVKNWTISTTTQSGNTSAYADEIIVIGITEINDGAFANAGWEYPSMLSGYLSSITLPDNIVKIGKKAFSYCTRLNLTTLPDSIIDIKSDAFEHCSLLALTELPSGVTIIAEGTFRECVNLALTTLPEGLTKINSYAFDGCTKLALTELPSGVTTIGEGVFRECVNLALTTLPEGLTSIGNFAFENCTNLALTELPSGVTTIGEGVFKNCTNLTKITCQGKVGYILSQAFSDCSNLSMFILPNVTSAPWIENNNIFDNTPIANGTGYIYVPDDLIDSFKSKWSAFANQIKGISELPTE